MNPLFVIPIVFATYSPGTTLAPNTKITPYTCDFIYGENSIVPSESGKKVNICNVNRIDMNSDGKITINCENGVKFK